MADDAAIAHASRAEKASPTRDFRLQSGVVMPEVTIAYRTLGTLSPKRDNAVLITHGNTSGPQMIDPGGSTGEGSWNALVGPARPSTPIASLRSARTCWARPTGRPMPRASIPKPASATGRTSRHHRARHCRHPAPFARQPRHRETGRDRGPILWRLPGLPMGGRLSRCDEGNCARRHRTARAARAVRWKCRTAHGHALKGSELERRRLLCSPAACWRA